MVSELGLLFKNVSRVVRNELYGFFYFINQKKYINERTILFTMAAEKSIIRTLKQMLNNDAIMYYILWKYAPDAIPEEDNIKTYADLCNKYKALKGRTEQSVEKSLYKEEVQAAIKLLLKRLDGKRDIELLNKYYDLAMSGDVQALKAYMEFKTKFFKDSEDDELKAILNGANTSVDYSDTEDFKMEF